MVQGQPCCRKAGGGRKCSLGDWPSAQTASALHPASLYSFSEVIYPNPKLASFKDSPQDRTENKQRDENKKGEEHLASLFFFGHTAPLS